MKEVSDNDKKVTGKGVTLAKTILTVNPPNGDPVHKNRGLGGGNEGANPGTPVVGELTMGEDRK